MTQNGNKKSLFKTESIHAKDFIVLNWHGTPIEEFGLYAEAYHCAAKRLVIDYGTSGAIRDFEATPILFLYRHAFELYLKAFTIAGLPFLSKHQNTDLKRIFQTHRLTEFIPIFEAIVIKVGWLWDMGHDGLRTKDDFVNLVNEFDKIDPGSFSFRYPINKTGVYILPNHFSFNLSSFAKRIDPLLTTIDGALLGLDEYRQYL